MTYDRLVCANCAAPVTEGRCPVCRANRARMQQQSPWGNLGPSALLALFLLLVATAAALVVANQPA
ncbi:hypothetical protein J5J01_12505 [Streptomyces fradiae]|uniref:hypothetical protein n=1 Tax=Streptomyces fradiae TaxID=1906 RepID=UPI0020189317|nr:hypothetical protein [Streptomyces fradiae]UQS32292.1 hypothetical protein J5J01_12505 [Streptomyces fradiae]